MKRALFLTLLAFVLWSCAPDPRREAEAFATRQQAEAQAARDAQQLQQDADEHQLFMSRVNDVSKWISNVMITAMVASMFVIVIAGVSFGIGLSIVFLASGASIAKRNWQMPNRIRLDPVTRQFPLLPMYVGKGKYSLANPNDGSVMLLDTQKEADALKVKAAFGVQHDGLLASRVSHRPEQTPTQVVDVS